MILSMTSIVYWNCLVSAILFLKEANDDKRAVLGVFLVGQFYSFTVYMVCANSIVNPFVYAIQYHEFQKRVKQLFGRQNSAGSGATIPPAASCSTLDSAI